jgi:hypothetical protein
MLFCSIRFSFPAVALVLALTAAGCAERRSTLEPSVPYQAATNPGQAATTPVAPPETATPTTATPAVNSTAPVITPVNSPVGRVSSVNLQVMIAVVAFPVGQVPAAGERYAVFRAGQKVGELKMSEETADTLRVADITSGALQVGDEVRAP